jgi:hypothetical protein
MNMEFIYMKPALKMPAYEEIVPKRGCLIGDHLPDIPVMRRADFAVQFLESTGHEPGAGAATQDVRASPGSPSVGAPGQEKSWRPQPQTTL